jgi:hypothetical protein
MTKRPAPKQATNPRGGRALRVGYGYTYARELDADEKKTNAVLDLIPKVHRNAMGAALHGALRRYRSEQAFQNAARAQLPSRNEEARRLAKLDRIICEVLAALAELPHLVRIRIPEYEHLTDETVLRPGGATWTGVPQPHKRKPRHAGGVVLR